MVSEEGGEKYQHYIMAMWHASKNEETAGNEEKPPMKENKRKVKK